jgi:tyrosine-protein kinase Etk/Wzc
MTILDQCLALLRWKRLILANTIIVAVASVIVALLLPKWYRSTASVFPPDEDLLLPGGSSGMATLAAVGIGRSNLPVLASPSDILAAVLESRGVCEEVIRRHDLLRAYKVEDMDHALKVLDKHVQVKVGGEGVVRVKVLDREPARAAAMANTFVELLDRVNREKRHTSARQARIFLEQRLAQNRQDMSTAEDTLRTLQERTGALLPEEQLKAIISAASELQVQLLLRETDLSVLRAQVGPENPELRATEREVEALRRRLHEVEVRPGAGSGPLDQPLDRYPALTVAYLRAFREVKVQETLYELLTEQYERYRIQENRDTPTVQVLDTAVPATMKAKPIRWLICLTATGLGFFGSLLLASSLEAATRMRREDPQRFAALQRLAGEFGLARALERL